MGRDRKPAKSKEAKPPVARRSPKDEDSRARDLEKRLAEALQREAEALRQLQTSQHERAEAQEHQFATAEILRVIAASPMDEQPVFDAIVSSAQRLLHAHSAALRRVVGGELVAVAFTTTTLDGQPLPPPRVVHSMEESFPGGVAARDRVPIVVADMEADPRILAAWQPEDRVWRARGYRSMLSVPLVRESNAIGVINVTRRERGGFTDDEIALLKTFADQAVIAIENVRLFKELQQKNQDLTQAHAQVSEALEQQTATAEVLELIASSPGDLQPTFDGIVQRARQLCDGLFSILYGLHGELVTIEADDHITPENRQLLRSRFPMAVNQNAIVRRVFLEHRVVHVEDAAADPHFQRIPLQQAVGYRTLLLVPMLREGAVIGAIGVGRVEPGGFTERQVALLQTFADQAVIAIENVRLFKELETRNHDLTTALNQQTATSEILKVISSSPTDAQPVFDAIVRSV